MGEIPGTLAIALILVDANPVVAGIIGAIQATFFRLDQGVHASRISAGDAYSDSSHNSVWQAVPLKTPPGGAAIAGFVQSAAWSAAVQTVRGARDLPQRSEENVCVIRIEHNVNCAGVIVFV